MSRAPDSIRHGGMLLASIIALALSGCGRQQDVVAEAAALTGGDPARGRAAMRAYGCVSCHTIPGVTGAQALVGPSLAGIAERSYIGGVLPNSPENLVRWIRDPRGVDPRTAMPDVGVSERDARDIAGYLYSLR